MEGLRRIVSVTVISGGVGALYLACFFSVWPLLVLSVFGLVVGTLALFNVDF